MTREFFRIVRSATPTVEDFQAPAKLGTPLFDEKYYREWAEGVSVYDDLDYALTRARRNISGLGRYVARIVVPESEEIEIAKTMKNRHHYTIYASAAEILNLVAGEAIEAGEENNG